MDFLIPRIKDIIDLIIVAVILYKVLSLVKKTRGMDILLGLGLIVVLYFAAAIFELRLLTSFLKLIRDYWLLAFLILFQPEIRTFLRRMSQTESLTSFFMPRKKYIYSPVLQAVKSMSFRKTGALILIENEQKLNSFIATGEVIDSALSSKLLLTIFNNKTILHDGAVVIRDERIIACKVLLPLSSNAEYVQSFGTRHLAAIAATEETDAFAIIVSEETGRISAAKSGVITTNISTEELAQMIADETRR